MIELVNEFFNEHSNIPWYIIGIFAGYGLRRVRENVRRGVK